METKVLDITYDNLGSILNQKEETFLNPLGALSRLDAALNLLGKLNKLSFKIPEFLLEGKIKDQIDRVARLSGINYRVISLRSMLGGVTPVPLLGFYGKDQKPVILMLQKQGCALIDPETQSTKILSKEERDQFENVYQFYWPLPEDTSRLSFLDLIKITLRRYRKESFTIILAGLLVILVSLFFPFSNKLIFDDILPAFDPPFIIQIFLGLIVATIAASLFNLAEHFTTARLQAMTLHDLQMGIWGRLFSLSNKLLKKFTIGEIFERIHYFEHFQQFIGGKALSALIGASFSLFYLGLMFLFNVPLSMGSLAVMLLAFLIAFPIAKFYLILTRKYLIVDNKLVSTVIQFIRGIYTIRSTRSQDRFFAAWSNVFIPSQHLKRRLGFTEMLLSVLSTITPLAVTLMIYFVAVVWILGNESMPPLTLGNFLAFTAAFGAFSQATFSLGHLILEAFTSVPAWERAREVLSMERERSYVAPVFTPLKGDISIENVYFSYHSEYPILKGINLKIKPGQFIGIAGPTGSGKSTLIRLLIGLEKPSQGNICYDGTDLMHWDMHDFRRQLGCVLQHSTTFDGSILENISAGRKIDEKNIVEAIKMAGLEEFIENLPMGVHTHLSYGGLTISQGQRQRLLIARALINQPRIILFDEATNALDNITQDLITKNLQALNITRIVVAHRKATIQKADRLYTLSEGVLI